MSQEILKFFDIQRQIYGICPNSGQFFRLSDCKIYKKAKPVHDWYDELQNKSVQLDKKEERLNAERAQLQEKARERGRQKTAKTIKKIDKIFAPRRLNADEAKVLFHGMKTHNEGTQKIVFLDSKSSVNKTLRKSIETAIEKERYEWATIRMTEDGKIETE
jgi:hypothetical protein